MIHILSKRSVDLFIGNGGVDSREEKARRKEEKRQKKKEKKEKKAKKTSSETVTLAAIDDVDSGETTPAVPDTDAMDVDSERVYSSTADISIMKINLFNSSQKFGREEKQETETQRRRSNRIS